MSDLSVFVVNPRKKKKAAKKKSSRRKRREKPMAGKKKAARRKPPAKRRSPARRAAPKRKAPARRRRRNPAPPARRRRRKNPSVQGGINSVMKEMKPSITRVLSAMATVWLVRAVGKPGGLFSTSHTSATMGESWGWTQYAIAGACAAWAPGILKKYLDPSDVRRGITDMIMFKFAWTEGIARSEWAVRQFGNPNDVGYDPGNGQMYLEQNGNWNAMQGYGNLVESSPLDGLVDSSPLDGPYGGSMGHLLPENVSPSLAAKGRYTGSGYTTNYHAAFTR